VLKSVAVLFHPRRRRAVEEAEWLGLELQRRGIEATVSSGWDGTEIERICEQRDLLVVLGGDGTIIHVARLSARFRTPLVGVNLGHVGFLAELTPEDLHTKLDDLVEERYSVEERAMLDVQYHAHATTYSYICLNEVAVARGVAPRAIHVRAALDGEDFVTYTADGLLVVTATGSTAYNLAAGGPILHPESREIILTPVAPHLHIGRSLVLPPQTRITLTVSSARAAIISVDGADEHSLLHGERVEVSRSEKVTCFARLNPRGYFYRAIAERLK